MSYRVNELFIKKINEIQERLPVKMNLPPAEKSFSAQLSELLASKEKNQNMDLNTSEKSVSIPSSNPEMMDVISRNISAASKKYGIDENLLRAVIKQESDFSPTAVSKSGAQGLMQLMPDTAKAMGVKNPFDVAQNIDGGAKYLKNQLTSFKGDIRLALAAYNAGPNNVNKFNGVPPYEETRRYIDSVLKNLSKPYTG